MNFRSGIFLLLASALPAFAQNTPSSSDSTSSPASSAPTGILDRSNLLGDPAGWRTKLNDNGWSPFATWSGEVWGNLRGGIRKGMTDDMLLNFGTEADLEKLAGWQGASLRVSANYIQGTRPNHNTGAFSSPTYFDFTDQIRVYNLYLRQKLFDDQVTLKIGQFGIDDDFCQPLGLGSFLNAGLTAPPAIYGQILANGDASLPQLPLDAPAAYLRYDPKNLPIYSMTGIYLSDAGPDASNNHGFDWHTSNSIGLLHEVGWHYHLASKDDTLAVGGFYNDGAFTNWDTGAAQRGACGVYGFVDQVILQEKAANGADPKTILSGFAYAGWAGPDSRTVPNCCYACGLNWNGPFPGRPQDSLAFAVLYTGFSSHYTASAFNPNGSGVSTASETAVELTYQMALASWFTLQPDAQLIFNPANAGTRATAFVVGARATISF